MVFILLVAVVSCTTYRIVRWWQQRRAKPVATLLVDEEEETEVSPVPPARLWQPDTSGENVFFIRTRDGETHRNHYEG